MYQDLLKGRGARSTPGNKFAQTKVVEDFPEGIDEASLSTRPATKFVFVDTVNPLSKNDSPDLGLTYSLNPYQGCEHGCIYCYARNSHQYWGFDSGLGFETTILVKKDVVAKLKDTFAKKNYQPQPIMLSGNTDCYQPAERTFQLTRGILQACLEHRNPVSLITKNTLISRDIDILTELAKLRLVHVYFSINHLSSDLKLMLEPRTATAAKKFEVIKQFSDAGIPCGVMVAPIIPGINNQDITEIIRSAAEAGALKAGYTVVRLNGQLGDLFQEWLKAHYPDRAEKVCHQIQELHGGNLNDNEWGRRIRGEGVLANMLRQVFTAAVKKYMRDRSMPEYDLSGFRGSAQLSLGF